MKECNECMHAVVVYRKKAVFFVRANERIHTNDTEHKAAAYEEDGFSGLAHPVG